MVSIRPTAAGVNNRRLMGQATRGMEKSFLKLSAGYRITRAGDDAAGLGTATALRAQLKSFHQASRNIRDAQSIIGNMEGALSKSSELLIRARELSMTYLNGAHEGNTKDELKNEINAMFEEVDRIATNAEYAGRKLLDGSAGDMDFQIGIRDSDANFITISNRDTTLTTLGLDGLMDGDEAEILSKLDAAINDVTNIRGELGSYANRLESTFISNQSLAMATATSRSRVMDVDVAEETARLSSNQVLRDAGTSVTTQINSSTQQVLRLLDK